MALAHERARQSLALLLKKMKFSPIVSIQGPRQCGKSYLASKILPQHLNSMEFKTLDNKETRQFADQNPKLFLESTDQKHLIIDEVQKVPHLFDEMKALVDEKRQPGRFVILGSTEFSIEARIKESLTGRLTRVRIYPLNLSEVQKLEINKQAQFPFVGNKARVSRKDVLRYLSNGGLPGVFVVKSTLEKNQLLKDWIDLTTSRDVYQFKTKNLDSDIAESILFYIAKLDEPTAGSLASSTGKSLAVIQKYLKILKNLFVIDEVTPFQKSAGKPIYYMCDVGLLEYYQASFAKKIATWLLIELRSQLSYKGVHSDKIHFFKSTRSQPIHFVNFSNDKLSAVKLVFSDSYDQRDLLIFESLKKKIPQTKHNFHLLYGGTQQHAHADILVSPWEFIV